MVGAIAGRLTPAIYLEVQGHTTVTSRWVFESCTQRSPSPDEDTILYSLSVPSNTRGRHLSLTQGPCTGSADHWCPRFIIFCRFNSTASLWSYQPSRSFHTSPSQHALFLSSASSASTHTHRRLQSPLTRTHTTQTPDPARLRLNTAAGGGHGRSKVSLPWTTKPEPTGQPAPHPAVHNSQAEKRT